MSASNTVMLIGNLTDEPTLRETGTGRSVVNFRIAANDVSYRNGERVERTEYTNVVAWNAQAENVAVSCKKGTRVMVQGRLQQRKATVNGKDAYFTEIVADEVGLALRWQMATDVQKHNTAAGKLVDEDEMAAA